MALIFLWISLTPLGALCYPEAVFPAHRVGSFFKGQWTPLVFCAIFGERPFVALR